MKNIDFSTARFKHLNWRFRLNGFMEGRNTMTDDQAFSPEECDLGKWYYSYGKHRYGHISVMKDFENAHKEIHKAVKNAAELKKAGKAVQSERQMEFIQHLSDRIISLLERAEDMASND